LCGHGALDNTSTVMPILGERLDAILERVLAIREAAGAAIQAISDLQAIEQS
jgi:hypothetical protein